MMKIVVIVVVIFVVMIAINLTRANKRQDKITEQKIKVVKKEAISYIKFFIFGVLISLLGVIVFIKSITNFAFILMLVGYGFVLYALFKAIDKFFLLLHIKIKRDIFSDKRVIYFIKITLFLLSICLFYSSMRYFQAI